MMHYEDRRSSTGTKGNDDAEARKTALAIIGFGLFLAMACVWLLPAMMRRPDFFIEGMMAVIPFVLVFWVVQVDGC